jgi:hypothetical protein
MFEELRSTEGFQPPIPDKHQAGYSAGNTLG